MTVGEYLNQVAIDKEEKQFRDQCAIAAMQGLLICYGNQGDEELVSTSYRIANAMLEARKK